MSLWFAMALAPITQPWGLIAAGVTAVIGLGAATAGSIVVLIVFVVLATSSYLVLELGAAFRPERAQQIATGIRTWIQAHTDQAIVLGSIGIGLFLVASSAYQLLT
jgi:predicted RND superfamily exporter protein